MSRNRKLFRAIQKYYRTIFASATKLRKLLLWLLRNVHIVKRRPRSANAGFVLPTVVMVSIVVVLLTMAILFRSFERSQNASNVRVNEAVLRAATPALDRAKAKISELFADPSLPRAVPSNTTLYNTFISKLNTYTLGDETPVILSSDLNKKDGIESLISLDDKEIVETAWKYPVDTDNNGKFDSFTLYSINFRNPPQIGINPIRKRTPLDARTPPMLSGRAGNACDAAGDTSASLVGSSGWYKMQTGELKKSFFLYAVTVPIADKDTAGLGNQYENYKGNKGFSAIELQQDRSQLPITNNAVVYEDDLDITPGPKFRLNGRIFTNSNLMIGKKIEPGSNAITLFQVSSKDSCYYERENSKIVVGGNLAGGAPVADTDEGGDRIDLFKENDTPTNKSLANTNKSTDKIPNQVAYNSQAFAERIDLLVTAQNKRPSSTDPDEVKDNIKRQLSNDPSLDEIKVRRKEIENYFRKRTRRVPFIEVKYGDSGTTGYTDANVLEGTQASGSNNALRPPDKWVYPTPDNVASGSNKLGLTPDALPAKDPETVETSPVQEYELGDRILTGNNLPELRWDSTKKEFVGEEEPENIPGKTWKDSSKTRYRNTRVRQLADLGATERDGFWEISAASPRYNILDVVGGLRVVTGAGVYSRNGSFLPAPPLPVDNTSTTAEKEDKLPVVWSDAMPMLGYKDSNPKNSLLRGDLVMRASAIYHYNNDPYEPRKKPTPDKFQAPIACVSNYYNPTNSKSATTNTYNPLDPDTAEASNNGTSYEAPSITSASITRGLTPDANGLFSYATGAENVSDKAKPLQDRLQYQANLVFPNGRFVNPLLRQALKKATSDDLTLSEQAAIDSTICAIKIADGDLKKDPSLFPNDAVKETAFLDARQIKAIDQPDAATGQPTGKYDLHIEDRQPLEIRATVINLGLLKQTISGTWSDEYLLPNSGIIYATRDDAQPDQSGSTSNISATDYKLDPTRRPNAIMLVNGSDLSRKTEYRAEEKGLILATDLPAYIRGDFNLHSKQEFKNASKLNSSDDWDTKFYTRTEADRDNDFACRSGDKRLPKCSSGETWRPASVIADAVTLLSDNFREGYRTEGDYDLRNNQTDTNTADANLNAKKVRENRLKNGFWDNNFITSSLIVDDSYYVEEPKDGDLVAKNSSYLNNFVTPVQRRGRYPEYVMEMCFKLPVSTCGVGDWYVGYDKDRNIKSSSLPSEALANLLIAGTTSRPPRSGYENFARRVAFKRNDKNQLINAANTVLDLEKERPIALGINKSEKVDTTGVLPYPRANTLWFTITKSESAKPNTKNYSNNNILFYRFPTVAQDGIAADNTFQPLLEPILQIQSPKATIKDIDNYDTYDNITSNGGDSDRVKKSRWLSRAKATTFNVVLAAGDTPARAGNSNFERNGGLHNFVRLLENWDGVSANISGSFIQFKRSIFATAPWQAFVRPSSGGDPSVFSRFGTERQNRRYLTDSTQKGEAPFFMAPLRSWGFDVGLLSQNPDLFAQRFVVPSTDPPNEYYREVSRDDRWVQTLLCSVQEGTGFGDAFSIKFTEIDNTTGTEKINTKATKYALPANFRPASCPVNPT
jgi:hypothetical protein